MTADWWDGLAPADVPVGCSAGRHRLSWARGRLTAPDHPDADRERALTALGADPFPCLDLLDAWERHTDDLDVLALAGRGPADLLPTDGPPAGVRAGRFGSSGSSFGVLNTSFAASSSLGPGPFLSSPGPNSFGWTAYAPPHFHPGGRAPDDREHEIERVLRLGGGVPDRLVATVVAAWSARVEAGDGRVPAAESQLRAALYGRLSAAVRGWVGAAAVDLTMLAPGGVASVSRSADRVLIELPFSWLGEVWCKGLATIFGQFCLSARPVGEDAWQLVTVTPGFGATRTMTVTLD